MRKSDTSEPARGAQFGESVSLCMYNTVVCRIAHEESLLIFRLQSTHLFQTFPLCRVRLLRPCTVYSVSSKLKQSARTTHDAPRRRRPHRHQTNPLQRKAKPTLFVFGRLFPRDDNITHGVKVSDSARKSTCPPPQLIALRRHDRKSALSAVTRTSRAIPTDPKPKPKIGRNPNGEVARVSLRGREPPASPWPR